MTQLLEKINNWVWGVPALILIIGVGLYLTLGSYFAQFRLFPEAVRSFLRQFSSRKAANGETPYRALCTALAATVGTGNLAGVAGAIAIGGPGAVLWMWVCGFLGMVTKLAEAVLSVCYRTKNVNGDWAGGPMYMIRIGLGKRWHWMAGIYAFFGVIASLGVGNSTQINAVIDGIHSAVSAVGGSLDGKWNFVIGFVLAILVTIMLLGGTKGIGQAAEKLVPFAAVGYIGISVVALLMRADAIPKAFCDIFMGAFSPKAVTGGVVGSAMIALRVGAARGVFTNEAGMGTASIAHASADVQNPMEQGMMGIMEVFLDTIVICTLTALVILTSGIEIPYGNDVGVLLTTDAFVSVYGDWIAVPIAIALCCFAFATVLGWSLYGIRCVQYLFGESAWKAFAYLQGAMVIVGSLLGTGTVWVLAEMVNGLMVIPNLITLLLLSPVFLRIVKKHKPIHT